MEIQKIWVLEILLFRIFVVMLLYCCMPTKHVVSFVDYSVKCLQLLKILIFFIYLGYFRLKG